MFTRFLIVTACLLALAACDPPTIAQPEGGAGGGTFELVYTYPRDEATGVPGDTPIVAIFSEDVDPATLEANLVVETAKGGAVKGTIAYDAQDFQATVTPPSGRWSDTTGYKVTLKTGITSKDGAKTLDREYTVGFTTK
jgi:hypothetical protein